MVLRSAVPYNASQSKWRKLSVKGGKADFFWALASQYGRILFQGAAFIGLARLLQADGYGVISGIAAFVALIVPFSGWGASSLILRHVACDRSKLGHWLGTSLILLLITSPPLAIVVFACGPYVTGPGFHGSILWGFFLAEAVLMRIPDIAALTFQAVDRLDLCAKVNLASGALRLVSVGVLLFLPSLRTPSSYVIVYAITSLIAMLLSLWELRKLFDDCHLSMPSATEVGKSLYEGFPFCLGLSSRSVYGDIDKTMLARMTTVEITGVYSAAYRVMNMAFVPAQALIASITVKLLRSSQAGVKATLLTSFRIYPLVLCYSLLVGALVWVCAPLVLILTGPSYTFIVDVLRALAWMPVIQATHFLAGDALMAIDRQGPRSFCQAMAAVVNVVLNCYLIARSSWRGAVFASYCAEGFLALSLIILLLLALRRESVNRHPPPLLVFQTTRA